MVVRRSPLRRVLVITIVLFGLGGASALADPLDTTTSKVITTIAHIIVERVAGSTVDRIIAPYIDDTLRSYLVGNPGKVEPALQQAEVKLTQQVQGADVAEAELPILKQQLALVQKELAALQAIRTNPEVKPSSDAVQKVDVHLADGVVQMEKSIDTRDEQLATVQQKLADVSARVDRPSASAVQPGALRKPSFDCAKATKEMEHLICDNPSLADIDGRLGEVYWELRHFLEPSESQELKRQEIAWIKRRVDVMKDQCMPGGKTDLPCVIGLWKVRISQLETQLQNAKARKL